MKEHMKNYKEKLEKTIGEYMEMPVSERSANAVKSMLECWKTVDKMDHKCWNKEFTKEDAKKWVDHMVNNDAKLMGGRNTTGAHWTMDQTTAVAESVGVKFDQISDWCWWATMNMVYSDYADNAFYFGVTVPEYFAGLAKAFLFDKDGGTPKEKIAAYYHGIVKPEMDKEYQNDSY